MSNNIEQISVDAKNNKKRIELEKAQSFSGQEDAALTFILQSSFADARYLAVQHIHSAEILAQVGQAMRNTDRRVAKLALERLGAFEYQKKMQLAAQQCLQQGQSLLEQSNLMANQVSSWDKERLSLGEFGLSLLTVKSELETRLQDQLELQRQVMQLIAELNTAADSCENVEQITEKIAESEQQWIRIQSHSLVQSLPKNQVHQLDDAMVQAQSHLQTMSDVSQLIGKRSDLLMRWQNAQQNELVHIRNEWQRFALPDLALKAGAQQQIADQEIQFAAVLARFAAPTTVADSLNRNMSGAICQSTIAANVEAVPDIQAMLAALELALGQGSLQQALDVDKSLRLAGSLVDGIAAHRVSGLRIELNRLLDWAKWGGNVSREELIKVADGLLLDEFSPAEIAKQVVGLRARWKELDKTSGAAAKLLWERFDEACSRAYVIADSYFKQQAQFRLENLQSAQIQLAAMDVMIAEFKIQIPDWKTLQANISKVRTEWRKLGTIDRKYKAGLEVEFEKRMVLLNQPILIAQEVAVQNRQQLIQSVLDIEPADRDATEKIKLVQQRWQQESTCLNLNRKVDQDLWRQFRAACDAVFDQRKSNVDQQKQQRQKIMSAKQNCCEQLENMQDKPAAELLSALRLARLQWRDLSSEYRGLETRFEAAVQNLEIQLAKLEVLDKRSGLLNLKAKIALCQKIEAANLVRSELNENEMSTQTGEWRREWDQLATVNPWKPLVKPLLQRFDQALEVFGNHRNGQAQVEQANAIKFAEHLLRLELMRNLPSTAELLQQRLALQVKDLQTAMKNRGVSESYTSNLCALCTLPVLLNDQLEQRFQAVLEDWTRAGATN